MTGLSESRTTDSPHIDLYRGCYEPEVCCEGYTLYTLHCIHCILYSDGMDGKGWWNGTDRSVQAGTRNGMIGMQLRRGATG